MFERNTTPPSYAGHFAAKGRDTREVIPTLKDAGALFALAFITGVILALAVGVIVGVLGHPRPWQVGAVTWAAGQAVCWLLLLLKWSRLLDAVEMALGVDIDGNGRIGGRPATVKHLVKAEVSNREGGGHSTAIAELPIDPERLALLGAGVIEGTPFAENYWTGSDGLFSLAEFRQLRQTFLDRGWLEWSRPGSKKQGVILTDPGEELMRQFAAMSTTPPTLPAERLRK